MRLSPQVFHQITGCRPVSAVPSPRAVRHERRVDGRIPFNGKAAVLDARWVRGRPGDTTLRDISVGGVALLHDLLLELNSLFDLMLETRQAEKFHFRCRVMRCARITDSCFSIGAAFEQVLGPDEIPKPAPATAPHAAAPRPAAPRAVKAHSPRPMDEVERLRRAVLS